MSFEPDNVGNELTVQSLLQAILVELKKHTYILEEMYGERIREEDLE